MSVAPVLYTVLPMSGTMNHLLTNRQISIWASCEVEFILDWPEPKLYSPTFSDVDHQ
jgi:hypothetical protein